MAWRRRTFRSINQGTSPNSTSRLLRSIVGFIIDELKQPLAKLSGPITQPETFERDLIVILQAAYTWGVTAKGEIKDHDLEPFAVKPLTKWDPERMESFEPVHLPILSGRGIISPVALGMICRSVIDSNMTTKVEPRAQVLVQEWFGSDIRNGKGQSALHHYPPSSTHQSTEDRTHDPPSNTPASSVIVAQLPSTHSTSIETTGGKKSAWRRFLCCL